MSRTIPLDLSDCPDSHAAALLFVADPHGFGGIALRGSTGPVRDRFLAGLRALLPDGAAWRRLSAVSAYDGLDGSLDLSATLAFGRPVMQQGLLAESDGGVIVIPMAERLSPSVAARLGAALDTGRAPRDHLAARFGVVALDEGIEDEALPESLADRLAFHVTLSMDDLGESWPANTRVPFDVRELAARIVVSDDVESAFAAAAVNFGIGSLRPVLAALRAARMAAAMAGRSAVTSDDAGLAARLVLAPRATRLASAPEPPGAEPKDQTEAQGETDSQPDRQDQSGDNVDETVREAVQSALPPGLLLGLEAGAGRTSRQAPGRAGVLQAAPTRGRPAGVRRGVPRGGARLNVIETLRAAAPWQAMRRAAAARVDGTQRVEIRRDDLRLTRFKQRTETVTLFAVDASGSLALQRLNEAKGAVELLLAECYVRRDQVALMAFRGRSADLLLPPTRSLARAKRCLASLAGGGATPLATALDAAATLADGIRRRGRTPLIVLFTDGRANVTRDGAVDRVRAEAEAKESARAAALAGLRTLLVDAAPRPQASARALAAAMNATYLPLPRFEAGGLTRAIRQASAD